MKVGVLLITHDHLGDALVETATTTLGHCPLPLEVLPVGREADPEQLAREAHQLTTRLDEGAGVLVLTDMYGSTPGNIACAMERSERVRVVAGVNLPMLIRVFNYASLNLEELADKALSGGKDGVMACGDRPPFNAPDD